MLAGLEASQRYRHERRHLLGHLPTNERDDGEQPRPMPCTSPLGNQAAREQTASPDSGGQDDWTSIEQYAVIAEQARDDAGAPVGVGEHATDESTLSPRRARCRACGWEGDSVESDCPECGVVALVCVPEIGEPWYCCPDCKTGLAPVEGIVEHEGLIIECACGKQYGYGYVAGGVMIANHVPELRPAWHRFEHTSDRRSRTYGGLGLWHPIDMAIFTRVDESAAVELQALARRLHVDLDSDGRLPAHAWPGGYPLVYYAADGSAYCPDCASQLQAEPPITACEVYEEGPDIYCDGCGKGLESAYGDPDAPEGEE